MKTERRSEQPKLKKKKTPKLEGQKMTHSSAFNPERPHGAWPVANQHTGKGITNNKTIRWPSPHPKETVIFTCSACATQLAQADTQYAVSPPQQKLISFLWVTRLIIDKTARNFRRLPSPSLCDKAG